MSKHVWPAKDGSFTVEIRKGAKVYTRRVGLASREAANLAGNLLLIEFTRSSILRRWR